MPKIGTPLKQISEFRTDELTRLRDDLSVTTAEEFASLATRSPDGVRNVIGADEERLARLRDVALEFSKPELMESNDNDYPYSTGFDFK